jgi:serine/threonine-protein kinase HipA
LWGLLPDNEVVLQRWGQKFRVSPLNPFRLIENIGEDCAGAIQFARPDRVEHLLGQSQKPTVHWISNAELDERIALLVADAAATRLGSDNGNSASPVPNPSSLSTAIGIPVAEACPKAERPPPIS